MVYNLFNPEQTRKGLRPQRWRASSGKQKASTLNDPEQETSTPWTLLP